MVFILIYLSGWSTNPFRNRVKFHSHSEKRFHSLFPTSSKISKVSCVMCHMRFNYSNVNQCNGYRFGLEREQNGSYLHYYVCGGSDCMMETGWRNLLTLAATWLVLVPYGERMSKYPVVNRGKTLTQENLRET